MKFFFWHGSKDTIFKQPKTYDKVRVIFDLLGIRDTIVRMHTTKGMGHEVSKEGISAFMKKFIVEKKSKSTKKSNKSDDEATLYRHSLKKSSKRSKSKTKSSSSTTTSQTTTTSWFGEDSEKNNANVNWANSADNEADY